MKTKALRISTPQGVAGDLLEESRHYPNRKTLLEFGKTICQVVHPQQTIERCADAMSETLKTERNRVEPSFLKTLSAAWDEGRRSVEPDHVFTSPTVDQ